MNLFEKEAFVTKAAEEFENAIARSDYCNLLLKHFLSITFACSFGAEDVVLVDMLQKISPKYRYFLFGYGFSFQRNL